MLCGFSLFKTQMPKPLADFFKDLSERQQAEVLNIIESLPDDVQAVIFPRVDRFNVMSTVATPLSTYWVDMDAFDVLRNIKTLNIDINRFFSYYSLPEIIVLLKGHRPEEYLGLLASNRSLPDKIKEKLREQLTWENLLKLLLLLG